MRCDPRLSGFAFSFAFEQSAQSRREASSTSRVLVRAAQRGLDRGELGVPRVDDELREQLERLREHLALAHAQHSDDRVDSPLIIEQVTCAFGSVEQLLERIEGAFEDAKVGVRGRGLRLHLGNHVEQGLRPVARHELLHVELAPTQGSVELAQAHRVWSREDAERLDHRLRLRELRVLLVRGGRAHAAQRQRRVQQRRAQQLQRRPRWELRAGSKELHQRRHTTRTRPNQRFELVRLEVANKLLEDERERRRIRSAARLDEADLIVLLHAHAVALANLLVV